MRQLIAFIKKEFTEQMRTGRLLILGAVFLIVGIMSPALAKLTPKLLEMVAEQDSTFKIDLITEVSAIDSFDQFYKNISMALIIFVIMQASIFTKEYSSGTLLLSLTRGMKRSRVIIAKTLTLVAVWTVCYALSCGVCYGYTVYFWDVSAVPDVFKATVLWWVYGLWYIALAVFFSTFISSATGVIACVGAFFLSGNILSMIPKIDKFLPTALSGAGSMLHGANVEYMPALIVALVMIAGLLIASVPIFNKRQV